MDIDNTLLFELHYYLNETDNHSMNAKIHNECEKYLVQSIQVLNKYVDVPIDIKVFPKKEGGLLDLYHIIVSDPLVLISLTAVITTAANQFCTSNFAPAINETEETKNKLDNLSKIKELMKNGSLTHEEFEYITSNDKDLKKLKSNFFKNALKETSISSIELKISENINQTIISQQSIKYEDFHTCILPDEQEVDKNIIDAKIYIVAPVLIRGRKDKWKGIYNNIPIEFKVSDKNFLENVYQHIIKFSNGTYINCKMELTTTQSNIDDSEKVSKDVFEVDSWDDSGSLRIIPKRRKKNDITEQAYPSLFY